MDIWPIGVFASLDAGLGVNLDVVQELKVPTIQLHAPHKNTRTPQQAEAFLKKLAEINVTLTVVFCGFDGESYADIPTVQRTVGLVPRETRAARVQELKEIADFAKLLGCNTVGLHIGFVPHDEADPLYAEVLTLTRDICDYLKKQGQSLHFETGQEPADVLLAFIKKTERDNLFINFDPANMILYGCGEPIEALEMLGPYVRSVHCKDATWSTQPGVTWGEEVPLGVGAVGMAKYLRALKKIGYTGPLTIEREIPQDPERQKEEIGNAIYLLEELKADNKV